MLTTPGGFKLQRVTNRKRLLLVDRDEALLYLCGYIAVQNDLSVYMLREPSQAFRLLSEVPIDLVVAELESTTLTGIDLTHHIRTNYSNVAVIVMTPFGEVSGPVDAVRGGATDYLVKPFSAREFKEKLRAWSQRQGPFRKWVKSDQEGLPEERTFIPNGEILARVKEKSNARSQTELNGGRRSEHEAILADAARTLRQLIRRDIEETAMFAALSEEELRAAFFTSANEEESSLVRWADHDHHEEHG